MLYDIFVSIPVPHNRTEENPRPVTARLNFTAGMLSAAGEKGVLTTFGPAIIWNTVNNLVALTGGLSAAYVNPHEYGNAHIGGPLQFLSHIAVETKITGGLGVGYYFQHLSNANLYFHNPGMNLNSFSLSYHF